MAGPIRTRIAPELRRQQLLEATHRVTLRRGLHDLRVADVAAELAISTGLVHHHFATKDELIAAVLGDAAEREIAAVRRALQRSPTPQARLTRSIDVDLPSSRRDPAWLLWIHVWGEARRDADVRRISEDLDHHAAALELGHHLPS